MVAAVRHSLLRFCARILRICRIVIPMGAVVAVGGVRTMVVVIMAVVHTAGNEGYRQQSKDEWKTLHNDLLRPTSSTLNALVFVTSVRA